MEEKTEQGVSQNVPAAKDLPYILRATVSTLKTKYGSRIKCFCYGMLSAILFILTASLIIWKLSGQSTAKGILIIGGYNDTSKHIQSIEWYQTSNDQKQQPALPKMLHSRARHVAVFLDNKIIYTGGENETHSVLASTEILDLHTLTVTNGPSLIRGRADAAGAKFENTFVVCGGRGINSHGYQKVLDSCEQLVENKWRNFTKLHEENRGSQMLNFDGKLFILGGLLNWVNPKNRVFEYDAKSKKWKRKNNMNKPHAYFGAVVYGEHIFVCGSYYYSITYDGSCEKYISKFDKWVHIQSLMKARIHFGMVAFENNLLVMGGSERQLVNGETKYTIFASVEKYCFVNDSWEWATNMKITNSGQIVLVLE